MKEIQEWKEAPLDCCVLALYQLQAFYHNEILRGMSGLGTYTLLPRYCGASTHNLEMHYIPTCSPEDIVKNMRESKSMDLNKLGPFDYDCSQAEAEEKNEKGHSSRDLSATTRAKAILQADDLSYDTKLKVFNVKGSSGITRIVTVFPKPTCSCPSTTDCYHILAVKLSLGMEVTESHKKRNLTQLRRNTRSRKEKRSGRKRPRPLDVRAGTV